MSWHTSVILIQEPRPADLGAVLERLGFVHGAPRSLISFEDATTSQAPGKSVAHAAGWTIVCDPEFFVYQEMLNSSDNQLWSPRLDRRLCEISASGSSVFGFITEGASGTHGFTMYHNGGRVRMWLVQGGQVLANEGEPLPEENECFGQGGPLDAEQGLLMLMGKLAVLMMELEDVEFQVFGGANHDDGILRLLKADVPSMESIPTLIELLRNSNCFFSGEAAFALTRIGGPAASAIPIMIERLSSEDDNTRGFMARALGDFGPLAIEAVPGLIKLLQDKGKSWYQGKSKSFPVRFRAAFALARIAPDREEIIPLVREALHYKKKSDPGNVLAEAITAITKHLGEKAQLFVSDLQAEDDDPDVMRRIQRRIQKQMALARIVPGYEFGEEQMRGAYAMVRRHLDAEIAARLSATTDGGANTSQGDAVE